MGNREAAGTARQIFCKLRVVCWWGYFKKKNPFTIQSLKHALFATSVIVQGGHKLYGSIVLSLFMLKYIVACQAHPALGFLPM